MISSPLTSTSAVTTPHVALGIHYLLECNGCNQSLLTDKQLLQTTMERCATEAGATVVETVLHQFNPHGLSGVVVIAESHLAIHTWPEHGYAAIDIFTCGLPDVAENIYQKLIEQFSPTDHTLKKIERNPPS